MVPSISFSLSSQWFFNNKLYHKCSLVEYRLLLYNRYWPLFLEGFHHRQVSSFSHSKSYLQEIRLKLYLQQWLPLHRHKHR